MVAKRDSLWKCSAKFFLLPPQFVISPQPFFFCPQRFFFREHPRSPHLVFVWSPTHTGRRLVPIAFSLCSVLCLQCESNNKNTALEALASDSRCRLSVLFVWERALWQSAHPEFDSFKEKIHPQTVSLRLISSISDVQFDGEVFWFSRSPPTPQQWLLEVLSIFNQSCGKKKKKTHKCFSVSLDYSGLVSGFCKH